MNSIRPSSTIAAPPHTGSVTRVSPHMTQLTSTTYDSPVGPLTLVASDEGLRAVIWPDGRLDRVGLAGETLTPGDAPVLDETAGQLDEYFAGKRTSFDLPLDLQGTPFQLAAWQALAAIPYAET